MSRPFIFIDAEGGESEASGSSPALASFCHTSTVILLQRAALLTPIV